MAITINTKLFSEAALYFKKHGRYDDGEIYSNEWNEYWDIQEKRCLEGYSVGGLKITGKHYFYLNFCPIMIVSSDQSDNKSLEMVSADRIEDFPYFWDLDWRYFTALDIAKYGIKLEDYNKLPFDLDINTDPRNIGGGRHFMWLKGRGQGASWKGAVTPAYNYFLIKKSKTFLTASSTEYLEGDGIFTKFLVYRDFINEHTGFRRSHDFKNDRSGMHVRASFKNDKGNEDGYMSEVMGITLFQKFNKIRGKRGDMILEELGAYPDAEKAWKVMRNSVEEGNKVFNQIIGFGTGGTKGADFDALQKMYFEPNSYNILGFKNIFDEGMSDYNIGFFTPSYYHIAYRDDKGNSDVETATKFLEKKREDASKSSDPTLLLALRAEEPFCPADAVLNSESNIFPIAELEQWLKEVEVKHKNVGVPGEMMIREGGLKFNPNYDLVPINNFPHRKGDYTSLDGCIVSYETPLKIGGIIPDDMYIVCVDTYTQDAADFGSLGAVYVMMNPNKYAYHKGDKIVASMVGRPTFQSDFNRIVFSLAEYYNAKIGFENNQLGGIIDYAKANKKLHMVQPDFDVGKNAEIQSTVKRGYGVHMNAARITQGDQYTKEWLLTERSKTDDGEVKYNLHTIYDMGLLKELIKYKKGGNFDRVSAFRVAMYFQKDMENRSIQPRSRESSKSKYFEYMERGSRQ